MKNPRSLSAFILALVLAAIGLLMSGCAGTAKLVKAMATDNACVSANISTVYGTARLIRFMPLPGSEITANPDGSISVRNAPPAVAQPAQR